jgi:hypothetical protein
MCTLAEPVPSLFIDWFHPDPTALLIFGVFFTFLFGFMLTLVWSSPDSEHTGLSRKQAALFMLGGYVCLLLVFYWGGALVPYRVALDAWYLRQQDVLSPECVSTVLTPAYDTAHGVLETWTDSVMGVLFVLGIVCVLVASLSRNIRRPGWWGIATPRKPPPSPPVF